MRTFSFENLIAWKEARQLKIDVYKITYGFPDSEKFGLTNQIRRSAVSVTANIAEGSGRTTPNDQNNFYRIAFSSCLETLDHIITALDLEYINEEQYIKLRTQIEKTAFLLQKLKVQKFP
jgi:four helix bundle protein